PTGRLQPLHTKAGNADVMRRAVGTRRDGRVAGVVGAEEKAGVGGQVANAVHPMNIGLSQTTAPAASAAP
ncbi:hypothetical protein B1F69_03500, partial [Pseudomonas syringae]